MDQSYEKMKIQLDELKQKFNSLKESFDLQLQQQKQVEFSLQERLKELNCHNQISKLMTSPHLSSSELIEEISVIIPDAWQFPDLAKVSLSVRENIFQTPGFKKSSHSLKENIVINNQIAGYIEVCYPDDCLPDVENIFLKEESDLLFSIATRIGKYIEKDEKDIRLQQSELQFRTLVETISEIVYEFSSDGQIVYISPSVEKILGYQSEELIGKSIFNFLLEEDQTLMAEQLISTKLTTTTFHVYRFISKSGAIRWLIKSTSTIHTDGKQIRRIGTLTDITERKLAEEALLRINRLYAVISQVNQAIVYCKDREKLLDEICRIAIEFGNFQMVWIGLVDHQLRAIKPCCVNGVGGDYLKNIEQLPFYDRPEDRGPTEIAAQEGRYFVCNNIENDPVMAPWKDADLKRGYQSSIALPIKRFERVVAVLNLYASTPDFFNAEEINLLEEVAGDISYALEAIETDLERKKAEDESRKFRTIIDQGNFGSAITTAEGLLLYVNPAFARMHQLEQEEVIGKHISIFHNSQQQDRVKETLEKLAAEGQFTAEEIWHTRKDGSVFPTLMNASIIYDFHGIPQYLSATAIDITELKQKENALIHREQELNDAQKIANMGSWEFEPGSGLVRWSENYYRLVDRDPSLPPLSLDEIRQMVYPDDRSLFEQKIHEILVTKLRETLCFRLVMPSGEIKWIESNIVPHFENNRLTRLSGISIDITEKKQAEEEIKNQNKRLSAIIHAMPDLIFVVSDGGIILEYYSNNPGSLMIPEDKIVGSRVQDLFNQETATQHLRKIRETISNHELVTYDYQVNIGSQSMSFEARVAPFGLDKALVLARNITEKKQQEYQIRKLSQAVEQSPVIVVVTGLDGSIEYVNQAFTEISGYTYEEAIGQNPRILQSGLTKPEIYQNMWSTIIEGKQWFGEWINKRKNGELYWENVSITPIHDESGKISNFLAVKQDITERKKTEQQIRDINANLERMIAERTEELANTNNELVKEIEERESITEALQLKTNELENFFSVALDLLCIADTSGNFVKVNKAWENILGYSSEDLEHRQFLEFVHPDDIQATLETMAQLSEQHPILNFTNRYRTKDGDYRYIEWRSTPSGQLIYAAARDITERIKSEEEMKISKLDAEQANMAKSEFLSRMSHELRTPMNAILGFAQLLEMGQLSPAQRKGVDHILHGGRHLLDLINEVLDISRIESGRMSLSSEPVRLKDVLEEMIDILNPLAKGRDVTLSLVASPLNMYYVKADRQRLKQVLLNLVNNAIKYNKPGGNVLLKTEISTHRNEHEFLRILVTDTGIGIHENDIQKLFKPFERIGAEQTEVEGSGLGLAVVKKLMDAMEGSLGVESKAGEGSTFWIELPRVESQLESNRNVLQTDLTAHEGENGVILYIEDNLSNVELVEQIISTQRPDIQLITHPNGKMALDLALQHKPTLIFLDLNLPDIHGSEVFQILQNDSRTQGIPVVVISADAMPQQITKLLSAGARKYLTKPLDVIEFLRVIDYFFEPIS